MSWRSLDRRRVALAIVGGVIGVLTVSAWPLACREGETFVTPLELAGIDEAGLNACVGDQGFSVVTVDLISVHDTAQGSPGIAPDCRRCGEQGVSCQLASRECRCAGQRQGAALPGALSGISFAGLDPAGSYCIRAMTISLDGNDGPSDGPGAACNDSARCTVAPDKVSACILSPIDSPNESAVPIRLVAYYCSTGLQESSRWEDCIAHATEETCCRILSQACVGDRDAGVGGQQACLLYVSRCTGRQSALQTDVAPCVGLTLQ